MVGHGGGGRPHGRGFRFTKVALPPWSRLRVPI